MDEIEKEQLREDDYREMEAMLGAVPREDKTANAHTFLTKVAEAKDTTKTGFLSDTELGMLPQTQRSFKELALISGEIMGNDYFKNYFDSEAEILTATSLSKNAKLIELAVIQRREFSRSDGQQPMRENKGWFKKKSNPSPQFVSAY